MWNELKEQINNIIKDENLFVDDICITKENNLNNLNICLDSNEIIDVNKIERVSGKINSLVDDLNIVKENDIDVVDIYSKTKGVDSNE